MPDIVIVHVTSPARIVLLQDDAPYKGPTDYRWIQSVVLAFSYDRGGINPTSHFTELQNTMLRYQSDSELAMKMIIGLMMLRSIVKEMTGKYPIFTTTTDYIRTMALELVNKPSFKLAVESSGAISIPDELISCRFVNNTKIDTLPCGHHTKDLNDRFALSVETYLRKNNVIVC